MRNLSALFWIELRKAVRSRMPLWTAFGSLFFPLGIAFLIFVARNPEISRKLGLISAKADLLAYSATDWSAYLGVYGLIIAAGGFILFVFVISWVFGREFTDGTLKDLLAVPVPRSSILLAKFITVAVWSSALSVLIVLAGLVMGILIGLPGGSLNVFLGGGSMMLVTTALVIMALPPFAFFASLGRGYLLPIAMAVLVLMMANVVMLAGWADYFPWAVPALYAQGESPLPPASYWIVLITGLLGMLATFLWWKYAEQSR
jgi:ABC-2 type transport system permease protein